MRWSGVQRPWRARLAPGLALAVVVLLAGCSQGLAQPPSGPAPTPIRLTSSTSVGVSSAPPGAWQALSGYTRLQQPSLTPDPFDPNTAYLCSIGPGGAGALSLQRTTDGGATWEGVNGPPGANPFSCSLSIDPANSEDLFLYLGFSGFQTPEPGAELYRSQDSGYTWSLIHQPGAAGSLQLTGPEGTVPIVSWNRQQLFGLAVPWDPNMAPPDTHRLFTSRDNGQTWQPVDTALVKQGLVVLAFTEVWGHLLAVTGVTGVGAARAQSSGPHSSGGPQADLWTMDIATGTWSQQPSAIPDLIPLDSMQPDVQLLSGDVPLGPRPDFTLYYVRGDQPVILQSQDDGASWTPVPLPTGLRFFVPLAVGANEALYGYTLFDTASEPAYQGIFWGSDGAWHLATPGMPPSSIISVTPEGVQSGLDSWWALDTAALTVWHYESTASSSTTGTGQPTTGPGSQ